MQANIRKVVKLPLLWMG